MLTYPSFMIKKPDKLNLVMTFASLPHYRTFFLVRFHLLFVFRFDTKLIEEHPLLKSVLQQNNRLYLNVFLANVYTRFLRVSSFSHRFYMKRMFKKMFNKDCMQIIVGGVTQLGVASSLMLKCIGFDSG